MRIGFRSRRILSYLLVIGLWIPLMVGLTALQSPTADTPPEWVPFVATWSARSFKLTSSGKELISEKLTVRMRDSNGSIYNRSITISGIRHDHVTLDDNRSGNVYSINYSRKEAVVIRSSSEARRPRTAEEFANQWTHGEEYLGTKTIDGIECVGYMVSESVDRSTPTWFAPSLNFAILQVTLHPRPDVELLLSLEDIRVGEEPDPNLFQIPEDFIVIE